MNWFSKIFKQQKTFDTERRAAQAAESILINEALTDELNDEAATLLLNWGVAWAERIAHATARLDDEAAREEISPKLKAIRKLMRQVNRWGGNIDSLPEAKQSEIFAKIVAYTKLIFPKTPGLQSSFHEKLPQLSFEDQTQLVKQLYQLFNVLLQGNQYE